MVGLSVDGDFVGFAVDGRTDGLIVGAKLAGFAVDGCNEGLIVDSSLATVGARLVGDEICSMVGLEVVGAFVAKA